MKNKWIIAAILIVTLIALCVAMLVIVRPSLSRLSTSGMRLRVLQVDRYSAEADQEWSFKVDSPATLAVDSRGGDITITGGEGTEIKVSAHKTAWDSSQARADAALAEMPLEVKQEGNKVTVSYNPPSEVLVVGESRRDTVDFTISVPATTAISASTDAGDIALNGVQGEADLTNQFGNITASDIEGSLQAITNSGDVRAQRIRSDQEAIKLQTQFGDISLEQAAAGTVDARTNSGNLTLTAVEAVQAVTLHSQFGDIQFTGGRAVGLTIEANSGKITLRDLTLDGALVVKSQFGDLDISQVTAPSYDLTTNSGDISLNGAGGPIKATTEFGRISIEDARNATLTLHTNSGAIEFSGSLGDGPHSLEADFGDIRLKLPEDVRLTFDLQAKFGKLRSDFPVTLSGEMDEGHWNGTINGGGPSLQARTNSGNISLEILSK